jgi:ammonium transporter, Amt family
MHQHKKLLSLPAVCSFVLVSLVALSALAETSPEPPLSWEQFRDQTGLSSSQAIENSPLGRTGGYGENALWTVAAGILVFWMQAGFAFLEAGFTRAKNAVNILMKNMMDFTVGSIAYWALGFGLMFGVTNGFVGTTDFFVSGDNTWLYTFLFFQTVFAGTAATIVSGAMAERTKFVAYLIFSMVMSGLIYPIFGSWAWGGAYSGGGWLEAPPGGLLATLGLPKFTDFAGSTVVHSIGGWAGLAGVMAIGPRLGKYGPDAQPIRGHSMSHASLGVFILWMAWFGFNAGSTTSVTGGTDPMGGTGKAIGLIAINTNLAACAGCNVATFLTWMRSGKPEISMSLNGVLAGLVGVTASCAYVTPVSALIIGAVAGVLVVYSVEFWENLRIDDPVGAISVHAVCGTWGTLAVGLFHHQGFDPKRLITQMIGAFAAFVWSFGTSFIAFKVLAATTGLRVDVDDELDGLDLSEHGSEAYPRDA